MRFAPKQQIETGRLVGANDVVVSMYESDRLEARFVLTDERFGRLQAGGEPLVGRPVRVIWEVGGTDYEFNAVIDRIGADIASSRGGVELFATIMDDGTGAALRPGAFVTLKVADRDFRGNVKLPETALYNGDTVYAVVDGELQERSVRVSAYDGESVLIGEGIADGEEVLVTRISEISSGLKVRSEGGRQEAGNRPGKKVV